MSASPAPVRSPTTPRGKHGYVVHADTGAWLMPDGYWTNDLRRAKVFATADEASKDRNGDPSETAVYSLALVRQLVGEREGRG